MNKLHASSEDYLKAIWVLRKRQDRVRAVDLAHYLGYSKASVSHAVHILEDSDYLSIDAKGFLHLSPTGKEIAENMYERHQFFTRQLTDAGVDRRTAEEDACHLEHAISEVSFQKLKEQRELIEQ